MKQRKLIWFAIVWSTFIYAFLAYWFGRAPEGTFDEALKRPLVLGLYLAALAVFIASIVAPTVIREKNPQGAFIMALAMSEACAIFGLTATFLFRDWRLFVAPWVLALFGFIREWPSTSAE